MSTNSLIGRKIADNKVEYIYCHWDGYIENGVGDTLSSYYLNNDKKINQLFENGNLSSLYDTIEDNTCCKDRGEDDWESEICTEKEYIEGNDTPYTCSFRYLFTDDKLICYEGFKGDKDYPLEVHELD